MNDDFWKRVDALEDQAGKATQGEWVYDEVGNIIRIDPQRDYSLGFAGRSPNYKNNALYTICANPAFIQEMIAEMRKMWRKLNWDVECLKAYGALPEDMEVTIDDESFAFHLNRIKKGLGKRLEDAEARAEDLRQENEELFIENASLKRKIDRMEKALGMFYTYMPRAVEANGITGKIVIKDEAYWKEMVDQAIKDD